MAAHAPNRPPAASKFMSRRTNKLALIVSNLRFYARGHLGTLLGVTVAGAILVGALAIGDCVRESLRDLALARIGRTTFVLGSGDRFFRSALAEDFQPAAAVLELPGTAATPDDAARANHVQILGVNTNFWALAQTPVSQEIPPNSVALNTALARQLRVKAGDTIILHVQKPSLLSQEAPISPREDVSTGMRLTVSAVVSDAQFGRFGLQANQASPLNAFLPLSVLQSKVDQPGRANLLLTSGPKPDLKKHWTLADAGLEWRDVPDESELRSGRVFIDPAIVEAIGTGRELILTYFVNELRDGQKTTPYSMVTAAEAPLVPPDMKDDEIIVNQWLADDLQAKDGDELQLTYFVLGATHRLEQKTNSFRVRSLAPMEGPTADRTLMPDFPGIAKAEKTENWDAGFAIDMKKIRPKDEDYWKQYRGTPKAFVTLAAGRRMWGNRFGDVTAIRFPKNVSRQEVQREMLSKLDPAALGLTFTSVREQALAASSQSEDFGELFIYFSFFLVVAALILLALLFHFGLERRATEVGVLLAVGWRPAQVRRLLLLEGSVIAVVGGALGVAGGILYARAILFGLVTLWSAAVAESPLQFHVTAQTLAIGGVSGILISTLVIWLAVRGQAKRPARELLEQGNELERAVAGTKQRRRWAGWVALASGLGALALVVAALARHDTADVESFFGAGSLLLICGVAAAAVWLRALAARAVSRPLTLAGLGVRGCARQRLRSVAVVALLASGAFIIAAIQVFKLDSTRDSGLRSSGTGGFAFIGESSLPIVQDLNTKAGREFFGLDEKSLQDVSVVSLRVHDGDDASCLNLNRAQTPRLLGVNPQELKDRFSMTGAWMLLEKEWQRRPAAVPSEDDEIPAIGDEATITWALHKKIGDTVKYTDEHGRPFKVRLVGAVANSILQGSLIVGELAFVRHFPGEAGYRMFMVDAPSREAASVSAALTRGLRDRGLELTPAAERLNAFNAVQNTFLDTFQVLGALGLLLGSAGLGVVVLRNVLERRGELALLAAVGFTPRVLLRLVVAEHAVLQALGLSLGIGAALLALLPALLSPSARLSFVSLAVMLGLVFLSGLFWTWAAARLALRGELLPALRNE
jgi:ABC-type antimicrobial peptide transport system permease subunit